MNIQNAIIESPLVFDVKLMKQQFEQDLMRVIRDFEGKSQMYVENVELVFTDMKASGRGKSLLRVQTKVTI